MDFTEDMESAKKRCNQCHADLTKDFRAHAKEFLNELKRLPIYFRNTPEAEHAFKLVEKKYTDPSKKIPKLKPFTYPDGFSLKPFQ